MRTLLFALILAAPVVAEKKHANTFDQCRKMDIYPSSCIGIYHWYTVFDSIAAYRMRPVPDTPQAKENRETAHRIHCAFNPHEAICFDENERKSREVAEMWAQREAEQKAGSRAVAAPMPQPGVLDRVFGAIDDARQRRREQPRQVVCYSETLPGPNGGTVQTRCY